MDTAKVLKRHCGVCGVEYEVKKYDADRGRGKFCSPKCSNQNKTKATAKHTAESGTAKTHCEISSDVIAEIQVEVDGIFPWKGKQGVCDKMTVELGVKELQVDINGKVVCFPVCTARYGYVPGPMYGHQEFLPGKSANPQRCWYGGV